MQQSRHGQKYMYEDMEEEFPEVVGVKKINRSNIGKILNKYQARYIYAHDVNNNTQNDITNHYTADIKNEQSALPKDNYIGKLRDIQHRRQVHAGMALNYSQIYQDLKLTQTDALKKPGVRKIQREQTGSFYHPQSVNPNIEEQSNIEEDKYRGGSMDNKRRQHNNSVDMLITKNRDYFARNRQLQSNGNRKSDDSKMRSSIDLTSENKISGAVKNLSTPRSNFKSDDKNPLYRLPFKISPPLPPVNAHNTQSQVFYASQDVSFDNKDKYSQKNKYQQNNNNKHESSRDYKFTLSNNYQQHVQNQKNSHKFRVNVVKPSNAHYDHEQEDEENAIKKQKAINMNNEVSEDKLGGSRSIGVGNYVVQYKDINQSYHSQNSLAENYQQQQRLKVPQQIIHTPVKKNIQQPIKQKQQQKISKKQQKKPKNNNNQSPKAQGFIINKSNITQKNPEQKIIIHYEKPEIHQHEYSRHKQQQHAQGNKNIHDNSRVMSTIKPVVHDEDSEVDELNDRVEQEERKTNQTRLTNVLDGIKSHDLVNAGINTINSNIHNQKIENIHENTSRYVQDHELVTDPKNPTPTIKQQDPQHQPNQLSFIAPYFNLQQYAQIYPGLKQIQTCLKSSSISPQIFLKEIKNYLEIISSGNMDNIDEFTLLPLNKKKFIKIALFYERVVIVLVGFLYVNGAVKEYHKYLLNAITYVMSNCMIMIRTFEEANLKRKQSRVDSHHRGNNSRAQTINQVIKKSDRLAMKRDLDTLRNNNDVIYDTILKILKLNEDFLEGMKPLLRQGQKQPLQQSFYSLLEYFAYYLCTNEVDHLLPFLAVCPNPYLSNLPPLMTKYLLVVDPVQLFCISKNSLSSGSKLPRKNKAINGQNWQSFRPFKEHFLSEIHQYYDIIFWSNLFPHQVNKVISLLDPKGLSKYHLYRHHSIKKNKNVFIKYVDRIGGDPKQIIMLDDESSSGMGSPHNCIHVPSWTGNKSDTILAEICPLLAMIVIKRMNAIDAVAKIQEQMVKNRQDGVKYVNFGINFD